MLLRLQIHIKEKIRGILKTEKNKYSNLQLNTKELHKRPLLIYKMSNANPALPTH